MCEIDPLRGGVKRKMDRAVIFAASHYARPEETMRRAIQSIRNELEQQLELLSQGKLLERQRLEQRTMWCMPGRFTVRHGMLPLRMTRVTNFGDPSFEPTDEELAELMREAFADVPVRSAAALSRIRQEIEELRIQAMARLEQRLSGFK
jgi:hypothetical protein